ncbi:MAG: glycosyltransferase [Candidatus Acidiferrales bacterium]
MSFPRLCVVMSVFNGQAFLAEAIESILNQTFRDFEFIIIDDGSTDKTAEILSVYARDDARIRVIHHENKGRTASLNIGISVAKGDYIARMDADDIALPDRFQQQIDFLERYAEIGLLGGAIDLIEDTGRVLRTVQPPVEDSEIKSMMLHSNPMWHPSVVMRKDVAVAAGGYRKAFKESEDYDLFLRIGERSQLANLANPVLQYRVHAKQVSVRNMRHQVECLLAARAAASLRKRGRPDPLWDAEEITPEILLSLEVTPEEVRQRFLGSCNYWMHLLKDANGDSALRVIEELLQLSGTGVTDRWIFSDAWLVAAGIHYKAHRPTKALLAAGHAVFLRPIVAGRPLKRALSRLATAMKV